MYHFIIVITLFSGASFALCAPHSVAVHVCFHVEWEKNWKTPPSPSLVYKHMEKPAPPLWDVICHVACPENMCVNICLICFMFLWLP